MKWWLLLAAGSAAAALRDICTNGECYPRVFEPTDQWQTVREGQEIPGGLHVRINMVTGMKEAKNIEPEQAEVPEGDEAMVVYDAAHPESLSLLIARLDDPTASLLDALDEYAHDMEDGETIALLGGVRRLVQLPPPSSLQAHGLSVAAAVLRNNPGAIAQTLNTYPRLAGDCVNRLAATTDSYLAKRLLQVLGALALQPVGRTAVESVSTRLTQARSHIAGLGPSVLERYENVFEDLRESGQAGGQAAGQAGGVHKRAVLEESSPRDLLAALEHLVMTTSDDDTLHSLFQDLVALKQEHADIPPTSAFLEWLAAQNTARQAALRKRGTAPSPLDDLIASSRHAVFGNRLAARKQFDE